MRGFESGGFAADSDDLEFYWHRELSAEAQEIASQLLPSDIRLAFIPNEGGVTFGYIRPSEPGAPTPGR